MNKELNFIFRRRSVRAFTNNPVTDEQVNDLMEAAMAVPSACCKDPWEFVTIRDQEVLKKVAGCLPNGSFLAKAPLGIIVFGDLKKAHAESLSYMLQDCSASIENILLAASAIGLGGCWLGIHPREERIAALNEIFNFSENLIPVGAIAIGVPVSKPEPRTRFNPAKVHDAKDWLK